MNPSDAIGFAQELMVEFGLVEWRAELDKAVRRFGACHYSQKMITFSNDLVALNDQACVLDIVLHEIAHALAGPGKGHGPEWKRIARSIGCSAHRCYSLTYTVGHLVNLFSAAHPAEGLASECARRADRSPVPTAAIVLRTENSMLAFF